MNQLTAIQELDSNSFLIDVKLYWKLIYAALNNFWQRFQFHFIDIYLVCNNAVLNSGRTMHAVSISNNG